MLAGSGITSRTARSRCIPRCSMTVGRATTPKDLRPSQASTSQFETAFVDRNIDASGFSGMVHAPEKIADPSRIIRSICGPRTAFVNRVYELDKAKAFDGRGTPESIKFTEERLAAGCQMLLDLWYTAWMESADRKRLGPSKTKMHAKRFAQPFGDVFAGIVATRSQSPARMLRNDYLRPKMSAAPAIPGRGIVPASSAAGEFPNAMHAFRTRPRHFVLFAALPRNMSLNCCCETRRAIRARDQAGKIPHRFRRFRILRVHFPRLKRGHPRYGRLYDSMGKHPGKYRNQRQRYPSAAAVHPVPFRAARSSRYAMQRRESST